MRLIIASISQMLFLIMQKKRKKKHHLSVGAGGFMCDDLMWAPT